MKFYSASRWQAARGELAAKMLPPNAGVKLNCEPPPSHTNTATAAKQSAQRVHVAQSISVSIHCCGSCRYAPAATTLLVLCQFATPTRRLKASRQRQRQQRRQWQWRRLWQRQTQCQCQWHWRRPWRAAGKRAKRKRLAPLSSLADYATRSKANNGAPHAQAR